MPSEDLGSKRFVVAIFIKSQFINRSFLIFFGLLILQYFQKTMFSWMLPAQATLKVPNALHDFSIRRHSVLHSQELAVTQIVQGVLIFFGAPQLANYSHSAFTDAALFFLSSMSSSILSYFLNLLNYFSSLSSRA